MGWCVGWSGWRRLGCGAPHGLDYRRVFGTDEASGTRRVGRGWLVGEPSAGDGRVERRGRSLRTLKATRVAARQDAGHAEGE